MRGGRRGSDALNARSVRLRSGTALVRGNMPRKSWIDRAFLVSFFESDASLVFCGLSRSMDEEEGDGEKGEPLFSRLDSV